MLLHIESNQMYTVTTLEAHQYNLFERELFEQMRKEKLKNVRMASARGVPFLLSTAMLDKMCEISFNNPKLFIRFVSSTCQNKGIKLKEIHRLYFIWVLRPSPEAQINPGKILWRLGSV